MLEKRICEDCGKLYQPTRYNSKWCSACNTPEKVAQHARERTRLYWQAIPAEKRKVINARYNNTERARLARLKYRRVVCTKCGSVKIRDNILKKDQANFICGNCTSIEHRTTVCKYCYKQFVVQHINRGRLFNVCSDCNGEQSRLAADLGLTRERARQLVNIELKKGATTRPEAIARVRVLRGIA